MPELLLLHSRLEFELPLVRKCEPLYCELKSLARELMSRARHSPAFPETGPLGIPDGWWRRARNRPVPKRKNPRASAVKGADAEQALPATALGKSGGVFPDPIRRGKFRCGYVSDTIPPPAARQLSHRSNGDLPGAVPGRAGKA